MGRPSSIANLQVAGIVAADDLVYSLLGLFEAAGQGEEFQDRIADRLDGVESAQSPSGDSRFIEIKKIGSRRGRESKILRIDQIEQSDAVCLTPRDELSAEPDFQLIMWLEVEDGFPGLETILVVKSI
ncbi:MAG: hypothetical protein E6J73_17385 [Deltaproteobacteria bacterium]|nr:MAG: hypothetical protein E6J73_17385 [Deltaproteobacteria bacterium]